jgi:hypothetical protein
MAKEITVKVAEKMRGKLINLPEKTPAAMPVMATLEGMKAEIEAALARGYSRAEIVALLNSQGPEIEIKEYQIKNLFKKPREKSE